MKSCEPKTTRQMIGSNQGGDKNEFWQFYYPVSHRLTPVSSASRRQSSLTGAVLGNRKLTLDQYGLPCTPGHRQRRKFLMTDSAL